MKDHHQENECKQTEKYQVIPFKSFIYYKDMFKTKISIVFCINFEV